MKKKSAAPEFKLTTATIVLLVIAWAIAALLFFLLFSVPLPGQGHPGWYGIATYVLENTAFLGAGVLCLRNWRSPQIVSGRTVWLTIGLGLLSYFIGNLFLGYWEIGLGKSPDVSPGDFFFIATYIFLGWGMLLAVISRQLSLSPIQWVTVAGISLVSVALAYFLVFLPAKTEATSEASAVPTEAAAPAVSPSPEAGAASPSPTGSPFVTAPEVTPSPSAETAPDAAAEAEVQAPEWAIAIENILSPLTDLFLLLYIIGDVFLVSIATMLLMAFWGGRFSLSWRFIAAAAFSLYIADLWFLYAVYNIPDYETGALPEVFYIFSPCLFGIGAALEFSLSTRSRRGSRRRAA